MHFPHPLTSGLIVLLAATASTAATAEASICDSPGEDWLMCEDFEGGGSGWADWFQRSAFVECRGCSDGMNNPDRLTLSNDSDHVFHRRKNLAPRARG